MPPPTAPSSFIIARKAILAFRPGTATISNKPAVLLTWGAVSGAAFRIEKHDGTSWAFGAAIGQGFTSHIVSDLALNTTWKFRIRSEDDGGFSTWVETGTWTTPGALPTSAGAISLPSSIAVTDITATGATVTWADNSENDGGFEIRVFKPGGGYVGFVTPALVTAHRITGLLPDTLYGVAMAGRGGKSTTANPLPLVTAFSSEITFNTIPEAIEILPQPNRTLNNRFAITSFTIELTDTPTTFTATGLPTGLSFNDTTGVISGTPNDAAGVYEVEIYAENSGGNDTRTFTITLIDPVLVPLWRDQVRVAPLGDAFTFALIARNTPPVPAADTFSATGLADWMSLNTGTGAITGTPTRSGSWGVFATAQNSALGCSGTVTIVVPGVTITSASSVTGYVGQQLSFAFTADQSGVAWTTSDTLPVGLNLSAAGVLSGTPATAGISVLDIVATLGDESATQSFTIVIAEAFDLGAATLDVWVGESVLETVHFAGAGTVIAWSITGAPAGLSIAAAIDSVFTTNYATIAGTPLASTEGIYKASILANVRVAGVISQVAHPITIRVSGGLFLAWLHEDFLLQDLQIFLRDRSARGLNWKDNEGLYLKRGDDVRFRIIFRDGPMGTALGRTVVAADTFDRVTVTIRALNDFDGDPLLEFTTSDTLTIGGYVIFGSDVRVEGNALEAAFDALNDTAGAEPTSASIAGMAEATFYDEDSVFSTRTFPVVIAQDASR